MKGNATKLEELRVATQQLNAAVNAWSVEVGGGSGGNAATDRLLRQQIALAATSILTAVKDPAGMGMEAISQVTVITANRIFWEWGVFDGIPTDEDSGITYAELATMVNADASLLARIGAVLVSAGILRQIEVGRVAHTSRSSIFARDQMAGFTYQMAWDNAMASYATLPQYFQKYGRKEPQTQDHVPVTFAAGMPELTYYELLKRDHARRERFTKAMGPLEESMPITGIYDFSWAINKVVEEDSERVLFVDIGGGNGHALLAIHREFPGLPLNRCMLQDLPEVIQAVTTEAGRTDLKEVQKMAIDFNREQPQKGALIYWIRRCLHNHSDLTTINILKHVADAMATDSKLLIQEDILDDMPNALASVVDMLMMSFGGKQRNLDCWEEVTSEAGLRISGVFKGTQSSLGVIECVKQA